jgi:hypothetical protein
MTCEEHGSAPWMYCQKCDTFVCDRCHAREKPSHYHHLFLSKPEASQDTHTENEEKALHSSLEKIKSIEEEKERKIKQAIEIAKRNVRLKEAEKKT